MFVVIILKLSLKTVLVLKNTFQSSVYAVSMIFSILIKQLVMIKQTCPCNVYEVITNAPLLYSKTGVYMGIQFSYV